MMSSLDELSDRDPADRDPVAGPDVELFDVPRGICPRCGSGQVWHHGMGDLVDTEAMDSAPG